MGLFNRLNTFLNSKKGNALLFTMVAAIVASMGTFLFVSVASINDAQKQRIAHLYNAYKMAEGITGKVSGTAFDENHLDGEESYDGLLVKIGESFTENAFITLRELITVSAIFVPDNDPTPEMLHGDANAAPYDLENSGVRINYIDKDGNGITLTNAKSEDKVAGVKVLVNLAGTTDIGTSKQATNHPYAADAPFYYVLMDNASGSKAADGLAAALLTIDDDHILSAIISPEMSVVIPSDADGYVKSTSSDDSSE